MENARLVAAEIGPLGSAADDLDLAPAAARPRRASAPASFADAMSDPRWFGPWFSPAESWRRWRVAAKVLFGEPLTPAERDDYVLCTGRQGKPPSTPAKEAWFAVGRRGGKSQFVSAVASWLATQRDWKKYLKPGERGYALAFATDKDQAGVVFDFMRSYFEEIPGLRRFVGRGVGKESIALTNGVTLRVQVASFRRLRGRTVVAAICDEAAFWYSDEQSANPDSEILKAIRPAMLTIPESMLLVASSPYAQKGVLWDAVQKGWAVDDARVLVWRGSTLRMNPSADAAEIERAFEDDPESARAEYDAEFREDIASYVSAEVLKQVTVAGRSELPYEARFRHLAFVDVAGGSGKDSMALAIARADERTAVLCKLIEWRPPFSPEAATAEACEVLKSYGLSQVTGDKYAGEFPAERFRANGIKYVPAEKVRSELYLALLPILNGAKAELLDNPRGLRQLAALERRTSRQGRDSVDHPPRGNDDLANVIAGALVGIGAYKPGGIEVSSFTKSTNPADWAANADRNSVTSPQAGRIFADMGAIHPHERVEPVGPSQWKRRAWGGV